jgi:hypothetical protein
MNFQDPLAPGPAVQPINILRDQGEVIPPVSLQRDQGIVAGIRLNLQNIGPPLMVKVPNETRIFPKTARGGDIGDTVTFPEAI